jgi:hypothetical protein
MNGAANNGNPHMHPLKTRTFEISSGNATETLWVSPEGVWRLPEGGTSRQDLVLINTSQGTPGIPQSEIRKLEMTSRLLSHIPIRGVSSSTEHIHDHMKILTEAFAKVHEEVSGNSQQHRQFIEDAFRDEVKRVLNLHHQMQYPGFGGRNFINHTIDTDAMAKLQAEGIRQADIFVNAFFGSFRNVGQAGAFETAWAALQFADKTDNVNPDGEESELISKDYFWGTWTLIYSCGKVEIITEKQLEEDPEARRKVNEPVSGGFPGVASNTGTKTASPSISVASGVSL